MKTNLNEMIDVFKVQCRCERLKRGGGKESIYEDEVFIINNFETAVRYFQYMVTKCDALGYYAKHDYWIKLRKCEILNSGELNWGEVILSHLKGEKTFDKRRIVLKIKPDLGIWAIYDNKEERFLEETKPFYAFDTEWKGWEAITDNVYLQNLNRNVECVSGMGTYEICVKGSETYTIYNAESEEDAIIQAIDCFCDDDNWYGSEETENVTKDDCKVVWFNED